MFTVSMLVERIVNRHILVLSLVLRDLSGRLLSRLLSLALGASGLWLW